MYKVNMFNCFVLAPRDTSESSVPSCSLRVRTAVSVGQTNAQPGSQKEEIFTVDRKKEPYNYFFL